MSFALRIATRYIRARANQAFISLISILSISSVALGVAALIIAMSVYAGFSHDIREKVLGANSHIMLLSNNLRNFDDLEPILEKVNTLEEVESAQPFLYTEVMLSSNNGVKGLVLRGIDASQTKKPIALLQELQEGKIADLKQETKTQGIIVGHELASNLGLYSGARVNLLTPSGQSNASGFTPKITTFKVVGIFKTGMYEYDANLAFVSLESGQDLLEIPRGRISGVEIILEDPYKAPEIAKKIQEKLGVQFYTRDWTSMNANLFAALELEKIGMYLVLIMIVLVGSFSIITSLVMLVMEKTKDIAILMSMGATKKTIRSIFILQGTIIGFIGVSIGTILGLSLCYILKTYEIIELPKGVYPTDTLPVLVLPFDVAIIVFSALFLCFLATVYPSKKAASLEPAKALRYE